MNCADKQMMGWPCAATSLDAWCVTAAQGFEIMKILLAAGCAALALLSVPAQAQSDDRAGTFQAKLFVTGVLPDGKIDKVEVDEIGIPATTQTKANDNVVPTIAIEYFVTNNVSIETICCVTQHDVDGTTGLPGAELVSDARLIPATFTAKYHFDLGGVKPYVGAGPALFLFFDEKPGAATVALGADDFDLSNELGLALQAGVDVPLNDRGLALSLDAKRYFIDSTARWFVDGATVLQTKHQLDPWVLSAGVAYRF